MHGEVSTTALYKALIHAQVPEALAEKAVEDLPHANDMPTKADLTDFPTKAEPKSELKAEFAAFEVRLIKWMVGMMVGFTIGVVGSIIALFSLYLG